MFNSKDCALLNELHQLYSHQSKTNRVSAQVLNRPAPGARGVGFKFDSEGYSFMFTFEALRQDQPWSLQNICEI